MRVVAMEPDTGTWNWDRLPEGMLAGEELAYVAFSRLCGPMLSQLFRGKGLGHEEAENLAVTCVTDIALKVEKFDPRGPGSFRNWVRTLALHVLADHYRRTGRDVTASSLSADASAPAERNEVPPPRDEVLLAVRRALERLDATDREILERRGLGDDATLVEIARSLGLTPGSARTRLHRAKKKLEAWLAADPEIVRWLESRNPSVTNEMRSEGDV